MTEKYAQHWCSMLSDPEGVFASCHSEISPDSHKEVRLTATAQTYIYMDKTPDLKGMTSHCTDL